MDRDCQLFYIEENLDDENELKHDSNDNRTTAKNTKVRQHKSNATKIET